MKIFFITLILTFYKCGSDNSQITSSLSNKEDIFSYESNERQFVKDIGSKLDKIFTESVELYKIFRDSTLHIRFIKTQQSYVCFDAIPLVNIKLELSFSDVNEIENWQRVFNEEFIQKMLIVFDTDFINKIDRIISTVKIKNSVNMTRRYCFSMSQNTIKNLKNDFRSLNERLKDKHEFYLDHKKCRKCSTKYDKKITNKFKYVIIELYYILSSYCELKLMTSQYEIYLDLIEYFAFRTDYSDEPDCYKKNIMTKIKIFENLKSEFIDKTEKFIKGKNLLGNREIFISKNKNLIIFGLSELSNEEEVEDSFFSIYNFDFTIDIELSILYLDIFLIACQLQSELKDFFAKGKQNNDSFYDEIFNEYIFLINNEIDEFYTFELIYKKFNIVYVSLLHYIKIYNERLKSCSDLVNSYLKTYMDTDFQQSLVEAADTFKKLNCSFEVINTYKETIISLIFQHLSKNDQCSAADKGLKLIIFDKGGEYLKIFIFKYFYDKVLEEINFSNKNNTRLEDFSAIVLNDTLNQKISEYNSLYNQFTEDLKDVLSTGFESFELEIRIIMQRKVKELLNKA